MQSLQTLTMSTTQPTRHEASLIVKVSRRESRVHASWLLLHLHFVVYTHTTKSKL